MTRNPYKAPNPQGKGLVTLLKDWQATRPAAVTKKHAAELLFDWFVSALVLSARFSFRPVVGQSYYLYCKAGVWTLSLVAPEEWGRGQPGACLGCCELRADMTWGLAVADALAHSQELKAALGERLEAFTADLDSDESLADKLPGYRRELPYYQRMLATGLGVSLRESAGGVEHSLGTARKFLNASRSRVDTLLALD